MLLWLACFHLGFNVFCYCNINRQFYSRTILLSPIGCTPLVRPISFSFVVVKGSTLVRLTWTPAIPVNYAMVIQTTFGMSPGRRVKKGDYKYVVSLYNAHTSPVPISSQYISLWGAIPAVGSKVYIRFRFMNYSTGFSSDWIQASAIVT